MALPPLPARVLPSPVAARNAAEQPGVVTRNAFHRRAGPTVGRAVEASKPEGLSAPGFEQAVVREQLRTTPAVLRALLDGDDKPLEPPLSVPQLSSGQHKPASASEVPGGAVVAVSNDRPFWNIRFRRPLRQGLPAAIPSALPPSRSASCRRVVCERLHMPTRALNALLARDAATQEQRARTVPEQTNPLHPTPAKPTGGSESPAAPRAPSPPPVPPQASSPPCKQSIPQALEGSSLLAACSSLRAAPPPTCSARAPPSTPPIEPSIATSPSPQPSQATVASPTAEQTQTSKQARHRAPPTLDLQPLTAAAQPLPAQHRAPPVLTLRPASHLTSGRLRLPTPVVATESTQRVPSALAADFGTPADARLQVPSDAQEETVLSSPRSPPALPQAGWRRTRLQVPASAKVAQQAASGDDERS